MAGLSGAAGLSETAMTVVTALAPFALPFPLALGAGAALLAGVVLRRMAGLQRQPAGRHEAGGHEAAWRSAEGELRDLLQVLYGAVEALDAAADGGPRDPRAAADAVAAIQRIDKVLARMRSARGPGAGASAASAPGWQVEGQRAGDAAPAVDRQHGARAVGRAQRQEQRG